MNINRALFCMTVIILFLSLRCGAQDQYGLTQGYAPFGSYDSSVLDSVDLSTGRLMLHIPIYSLPQRGTLKYSFSLTSNSIGWIQTYSCITDWETHCYIAYVPMGELSANLQFDQNKTGWEEGSATDIYGNTDMDGVVEESDGSRHLMYYDYNDSSKLRSTDGSGYVLLASAPNGMPASRTIYDDSGIKTYISTATNATTITDPNGNQISGSGGTNPIWTDSLNRSVADPSSLGSNMTSDTTHCPVLNAPFQPLIGSSAWVLPGPSGGSQTYYLCFARTYTRTNFFGGDCFYYGGADETVCSENQRSVTALQSIVLPNGTYWGIIYDSANQADSTSFGYGDLTQLILPSGGLVHYTYGMQPSCGGGASPWYSMGRGVGQRTINDGNGNTSQWSYKLFSGLVTGGAQSSYSTIVADPDLNDTAYLFQNFPNSTFPGTCTFLERNKQIYQGSSTSGGTLLQSVATTYTDSTAPLFNPNLAVHTANFIKTKTVTIPGGGSSISTNNYSNTFQAAMARCSSSSCSLSAPQTIPFGGVTSTSVTNFDGATVLQSTATQYQWKQDSSYYSTNLMKLPSSIAITGPGNSSTTQYGYDESGSPQGAHGNLTSTTQGGSINTTTFNGNGMPISTVDANGNAPGGVPAAHTTTISYDNSGIFPSSIQHPSTNGVAHMDYYSYDANTGRLIWHTDQNGTSPNDSAHTTTYTHDNMGRVTDVLYPPTTYGRGEVKYCYTDNGGSICSKGAAPYKLYTTSLASPDPDITTIQQFDGLGRLIKSVVQSDPQGSAITDTSYDGLGRVASVTNPYRSTPAAGDPPAGTTLYTYDALGRTTKVTNPDASYQQWCYEGGATTGQTNCLSSQSSVAAASWVDFSDEQGHHSQKATDALGRLVAVREPNVSGTGLGYETDYHYDVLGNLTNVQQNGASGDTIRYRNFVYDSLSRLTASCNPETLPSGSQCASPGNTPAVWSNTYSYDANGNLTYKSDARNVAINYFYDNLNRITSKTYSGSGLSSGSVGATPATCYQYDLGPAGTTDGNFVGRLTYEWTTNAGCSATVPASGYKTLRAELGYDAMGRLRKEQQCHLARCTTGTPYISRMDYNLVGNQITYSNGLQSLLFTNHYDAAGHLSSLNSSWVDGTHPALLYSGKTYIPSGAASGMTFGTGINVTRSYDSRLRPTQETAVHP
ncbi:MAG: repeat-containing protein [Acidobacteriaceae bacterium]|nr:repeat-containing protein [Acidobacteriaceae bacterium]